MKHCAVIITLALTLVSSTAQADTPKPDEVVKVHNFIRGCRTTVCNANARIGQDALTRCRDLGGLGFLIQSVDEELARQKRELEAVRHEPGDGYSVARELEESIDQLIDYRKRLARRHATQYAEHLTKLGEERRVPRQSAVGAHGKGLTATIGGFLAGAESAGGQTDGIAKTKCKPTGQARKPVITDRDCLPILNHTIIRWRCGR